ncbi:MAG: hypothetical protein JWM21_1253 [Acidobacteria bacterium]|nr:hypothetical protein [Acidobacteriota bacterium]
MAGKSERVKVEVKESTSGEVRTFSITLTLPACDFLLTDLLKQRGVIEALATELKQAVKRATENYLSNAETLIAGLATEPKLTQKSRSNGKGKGRNSQDERASSLPPSEQQGTGAAQ